MDNNNSDIILSKYIIIDIFNHLIKEQLAKPRDQWNTDKLCEYAHLKTYLLLNENADLNDVDEFMLRVASDDSAMVRSRAIFKEALDNMTEEQYTEFLKKMVD